MPPVLAANIRICGNLVFYFLLLIADFPKSTLSVKYYGQNIQKQQLELERPSHSLPIDDEHYKFDVSHDESIKLTEEMPSFTDSEKKITAIANKKFIQLMEKMISKYLSQNPQQRLQGKTLNVDDIHEKSMSRLQRLLTPKSYDPETPTSNYDRPPNNYNRPPNNYDRPPNHYHRPPNHHDHDCHVITCPPSGEKGLFGPKGPPGPKGYLGLTGKHGLDGKKGNTGPKGHKAAKAAADHDGDDGESGDNTHGTRGEDAGERGDTNERGDRGDSVRGTEGGNTVEGEKGRKGACEFYQTGYPTRRL